ncbi:clan AA aspartic protease [candidate division KSB1 bacterium]|nr:clan AA aspartic protease [candidate division KSB1 bacterium]
MKRYRLESFGKLLVTKAAVNNKDGTRILNLLIDTGSSYTILPFELLEAIGSNPSLAKEKIRIHTAPGLIIAPAVKVAWFNALGKKIPNFSIVAYTLPFSTIIDGLLGMDFLKTTGAVIDIANNVIELK